jgi:hypothetical protein
MATLNSVQTVRDTAQKAVTDTTITDLHTHVFPPTHGNLLLWDINELLTYHYLVAELFTVAPAKLTYEAFWKMTKPQQADLVWEHVFLKHGALSEATRGVMTVISKLGLQEELAKRDLAGIRKWFAEQNVEDYIQKVFELAGLDYAIMTNDPFVAEEAAHWADDKPGHPLMKTALRIDQLIVNWPHAAEVMRSYGYVTETLNESSYPEARRFLKYWAEKINPVYMAASLPPDFAYPHDNTMGRVMQNIVLPVARELNLPLAMMIGVRKRTMVNPALGDGGDAVGVANVEAVQNLCREHSDVKFLVTMLSRVNQHELTVLGRKFRNLHLFGCWWFCNNPSIIEEMTRQRFELLGTAFTANHSDARVLDQLIYKWTHTRKIVGKVLADKYADQFEAGWRVTEAEIKRDARNILGGSFEAFLSR